MKNMTSSKEVVNNKNIFLYVATLAKSRLKMLPCRDWNMITMSLKIYQYVYTNTLDYSAKFQLITSIYCLNRELW